jgi:hypothetical protein
MRGALIGGVVLLLLGSFIVIEGVSYTSEESVFKLGGIEAKMRQERRIPQWIGGLGLGAGFVLVGIGFKKRSPVRK